MKKEVGIVSSDERDQIRTLYQRRKGLDELARILTKDNTGLYERLVADIGETSLKFQEWWHAMEAKYQWEAANGGRWEIDFNSCRIYLITPE